MSYVPSINFYGMLNDIGDNVLEGQKRQRDQELEDADRAYAESKGYAVPAKHEGFLQQLTRTITGEPAPQASAPQAEPNVPQQPVSAPMALPSSPSKQLYNTLIAKGAHPNEAALLTGEAEAESGFDPTKIHDKGTGYGLWGHRLERRDALRRFAGTDAPNMDQQAAFALQELRNRPEGRAALAARTPEELAIAGMRYERPLGYTDANPQGGHNWGGRLDAIKRVYSGFGDGGERVQLAGPLPESTAERLATPGTSVPAQEWPESLRKLKFNSPEEIMAGMRNKFMKPFAEKALDIYAKELAKGNETATPLTTPEQRAKYGIPADFAGVAYVDKNGAPHIQRFGPESSTTVNVAGEKAYETTVGKGYGETMLDLQKQGRAAAGSLSSLSLLEKAIDDPGFYSGSASDAVTAAKKAAVALGISDAKDAAPNELFTKISNKLVLDLAGGSLGTGFSNADRDYLASSVPNLANSPEGNKQIISIMKKVEQRRAEVSKFARDYAKEHNGRIDEGFDDSLAQWTEKNPLFKNETAPAAAPKLGSVPIPPSAAKDLKEHVKDHPHIREIFDRQYGKGAAEKVLGPSKSEPET